MRSLSSSVTDPSHPIPSPITALEDGGGRKRRAESGEKREEWREARDRREEYEREIGSQL